MINAVKFYEELRLGSSLPLLVGGEDGNKYVVKLNGRGDGVLASVVEWVSSKLGTLLQIPVLQPVFICAGAGLASQAGDPETRELLEKSVGPNLATPYLHGASTYSESAAPRLDQALKHSVFLFDLFLLNVDRTENNPNMILHLNKLWCLDYSSAVEIRSVIDGGRYREHVLLRRIKQHPFYSESLSAYGFADDLKMVPENSVHEIVDTLPAEWIDNLKLAGHVAEIRKSIVEKLMLKKQNGIALHRRLDLLRVLKVETAEESRRRSLENKKSFEKKFGRL